VRSVGKNLPGGGSPAHGATALGVQSWGSALTPDTLKRGHQTRTVKVNPTSPLRNEVLRGTRKTATGTVALPRTVESIQIQVNPTESNHPRGKGGDNGEEPHGAMRQTGQITEETQLAFVTGLVRVRDGFVTAFLHCKLLMVNDVTDVTGLHPQGGGKSGSRKSESGNRGLRIRGGKGVPTQVVGISRHPPTLEASAFARSFGATSRRDKPGDQRSKGRPVTR
jgi:hypothetical protein